MNKILVLIVVALVSFCKAYSGGDAPQPLGSDVIWYKDTLGTSPFKTKFIGMWFSPDGKTIAVPQGKQLFLVSSETGDVTEKIDVGFDIRSYCAANDRYSLSSDSAIFIYDKHTYKLIKRIELPQNIVLTKRKWNITTLSPDGKTIVTSYYQNGDVNNYYPEVGVINVEGGNYKRIKDASSFVGFYSPDGKYFIAYESAAYGTDEPLRVVIYDSTFSNKLYDTWGWVDGSAGQFSFSADSKILYFKNVNTMYSINMAGGFKKETIDIQGKLLYDFIGINDTLTYIIYNAPKYPIRAVFNNNTNQIQYQYSVDHGGGTVFISKGYNFIMEMTGRFFLKLAIPYDKLTKTDDEITKINNGFTLSPNPFINKANFNIFLKKDCELSYTIYSLDGKEVKREYIGKYGAGYANGTLYLAEMTPGTYLLVFSGADKVAQGSLIIKKLGE